MSSRGPIHPSSIILVLLLAGLSMLFLALSFAFMYARITHQANAVELPLIFLLNIPVLLGAGFFLEKVKRGYFTQSRIYLISSLWISLGLTLLFILVQLLGWYLLFQQRYFINHSPGHSYLYALSILHMLHVVGGMPFLIRFLKREYTARAEKEESLRIGQFRQLKMIISYWHFIDILWIYLVLFLLVNSWF